MSNEIKKSKKPMELSETGAETVSAPIAVDVPKEAAPAKETDVPAQTPEPTQAPAPTPAPAPVQRSEKPKETIIAQPLKTVNDIKMEYAKMSMDQYNGSFVQPDGPVIQENFDLRAELTKILVANTDADMPKALVKFDGSDTNYYLVDCHPSRVYKAWQLYARKEGAIPGKFMEMLFSILKVQSKRYFHKVSTVELR